MVDSLSETLWFRFYWIHKAMIKRQDSILIKFYNNNGKERIFQENDEL